MLSEAIDQTRQTQWEHLRDLLSSYAQTTPVRRVAVVGNAPLEPDRGRAAAIDGADLVIRANSMMLDEPDGPPTFGRRCHVVILSRSTSLTPYALQNYRDRLYLIPQGGFVVYHADDDKGLLLDVPFWPRDIGALPLANAVVKTRVVRAMTTDAAAGEIIPTSGLMGLFLGHEMFPDAELLGTGFSILDNDDQEHWGHSYGGSTRLNRRHRLDLEAGLLRRWISDGSLRMLS